MNLRGRIIDMSREALQGVVRGLYTKYFMQGRDMINLR